MTRLPAVPILVTMLVLNTACARSADPSEGDGDSLSRTTPDSMIADTGTAGHSATGHAAPGANGQALLPIMQQLGTDMTALTYALMTDDHATVTRRAAAIANHAPIAAEEIERIHAALGPEMAAFEAVDESVHVASVRLHEAAQARQVDRVVERLGEVQRGCVSCHARFRERLRTNRAGR